jgi:hypothetical protein
MGLFRSGAFGGYLGAGLDCGGVVVGEGGFFGAGGFVGGVAVTGVGAEGFGFGAGECVVLFEEAEEGVVEGAFVAVEEEEGVVGVFGSEGVGEGLAGGEGGFVLLVL